MVRSFYRFFTNFRAYQVTAGQSAALGGRRTYDKLMEVPVFTISEKIPGGRPRFPNAVLEGK
jgi:GTPase involved in cell partitioning and DNA repair